MLNEGAPEYQSFYYSADPNYAYYYTGFESSREWENQHRNFVVDSPDIPYMGAQNDPYVYYNYGYTQSPYNPYNPYIPGAVIGVDGSFGGQHYYTVPNYQNPVSSPAYGPLILQPDNFSDSSVDSLLGPSASVSRPDGRGLKHKSGNISRNSSKVLSSQSSSLAGVSEGPKANDGRNPDMTNINVTGSSFLGTASSAHKARSSGQVQHADTVSNGNLIPQRDQFKVAPSLYSEFSDFGYGANRQSTVSKLRPMVHSGKLVSDRNANSDVLGEQNRGPRTSRSKHLLSVKAYTTMAGDGNEQRDIIIHTDQYNKEDFPLNYENAKFFVMKSYSEDDVHKSIKYNVWSSTPRGNKKLQTAYEDAQKIAAEKSKACPVILFFSVNASGQFCGVAEMVGPVDFNKDMDFWKQEKWSGSFPVKWHIIKDVPNTNFRHIMLESNENKPVTHSRDSQEIMHLKGLEMLKIFKNHTLKTSLLDDFMYYETRQKIMQDEKAKTLSKSSAMKARRKSNFVVEMPPSNDEKFSKLEKDSENLKMQKSISRPDQNVSNSDVSIKSMDKMIEKTTPENPDISSILKIGSVTINPKHVETKQAISSCNEEPMDDVLTVGSMQAKVNGFSGSSGSLKVDSILSNAKELQRGKGDDGADKNGSER